jgi:hypothetical protein
MAALMSISGPSDYLLSGNDRPPAIVSSSCGPSPLGSDSHDAFIASMAVVLDEVEGRLLAWYRNPDTYADDETDAPSREATGNAIRFVHQLKASLARLPEKVQYVPLRAATIGSGGAITLEFERGGVALTYSFKPDGSAEQLIFADGRLRSRAHINLPLG